MCTLTQNCVQKKLQYFPSNVLTSSRGHFKASVPMGFQVPVAPSLPCQVGPVHGRCWADAQGEAVAAPQGPETRLR